VDLGLVARPLNERERNLGLALIPVARDAVVIAAHPSVAVDNVSSSELVDLFSGRYTSFPDGSPATAFLRDRDDTAHAALERFVPGLAAARESAYSAHRFRVLLHDDAMGESLSVTPGSVGVFSLGAMVAGHLRLKVIGLDGAKPSVEGMQDGSWKATRDLAFVARTDRLSKVRPFLAFVAGPQGAALARASGYLPTPSELP
jgi:phosphate transport system substrate-binding protein